jgi:hypothetical protein
VGKRTPSGLRFFFDACFPATLAHALGKLDIENEYRHLFDEALPRNIPDIDWIPSLEGDRIVVSGDGRILTKRFEREVWLKSSLRGFFLNDTFPNKSLWEQAKFVVDRWEKILHTASRCSAGDTFRLPWGAGLKIEKWEPRRR